MWACLGKRWGVLEFTASPRLGSCVGSEALRPCSLEPYKQSRSQSSTASPTQRVCNTTGLVAFKNEGAGPVLHLEPLRASLLPTLVLLNWELVRSSLFASFGFSILGGSLGRSHARSRTQMSVVLQVRLEIGAAFNCCSVVVRDTGHGALVGQLFSRLQNCKI